METHTGFQGDLVPEFHGSSTQRFPIQEPIAIIGMACRFPRSRSIAEYWQLLINGVNAVVEGPPGSVIGRTGHHFPDSNARNDAVRFGAFVEDIEQFDAEFFRISPLEAQLLDPQQRMMLETTWQALDDAAIDSETLRGSRTGVYVGISNYDYRDMTIDSPETAEPTGGLYAVTGTALNTAIGRVAFALGLEGPALAIDTACSSSLVAIHQAVGGLQRRDADLAIAGGVHLFLDGRALDLRANAGMMSPEGQCKTFDAAADGFVCGEGCGLVILKRLSEAEADGDRIWGVIRGTSVNQDGASQGLTVPSGPSQERAIEEAIARAGLLPSDVDYLEAHGTGTVVGDPIELNAAASVYGRGRDPDRPILVGSVKTNIGHLAPAAGVAGLIKAVLAMRHGAIPPHLNFSVPNPRIDWDNLPVRVTDVTTEWPAHPDRPPVAGVNSFGWSGTNAHIVVQGYGKPVIARNPAEMSLPSGPALPVASTLEQSGEPGLRVTRFLPLSGKSPQALRDSALDYLAWLHTKADAIASETAGETTLSDMAWTASVGRSHFPHRAGVVFSDSVQLQERLCALITGEAPESSAQSHDPRKVAFVFTGQASQWVGMGETLYEREPVFRSVLDDCDRLIYAERGVSLLDVMFGRAGTEGLLDEPVWTQPAIYALECALTALWDSVGVKPSLVVGHSLGEVAASQAAGVLTLEEGLRFASARGLLLGATRSDGAMGAVFAPAERVAALVQEHNANSDDVGLSVAVDNGQQQVVSGPANDVEAVLRFFESEGARVVRLRKSPAYHSALIEPALDELEAAFAAIVPAPPAASVPLVSNISGKPLDSSERMNAAYWRRQARSPVAFRACVETLAAVGVDAVIEIGPHAVLGPVVSMTWPDFASGRPPAILASLRRQPRDVAEPFSDTSGGFVEATAGAYEAGLHLDFTGLFAGEDRRRISIPSYPFQRSHHWVQASRRQRRAAGHPLLGARHESPRGEVMYETELFPDDPSWLPDHLVYEKVVAPGGMFGAMAVAVSFAELKGSAAVDEMQMHSPLILEDQQEDAANDVGRRVQFVLDAPASDSTRRFEIFSKGANEDGWVLHADGTLSACSADSGNCAPVDLDELRADLEPQDPAGFYRMRSATGIYLGPSYHTLRAAWAGEGESLGELVLQDSVDSGGVEMHPLLLDGCFQVLSLGRHLTGVEHGAVYMPFGWERLWVNGPMPERTVCHAILRNPPATNGVAAPQTPPEVLTGDVWFYSEEGAPIGGLQGFTVKRATRAALLSARDSLKDLIYEVVWRDKLPGKAYPSDFSASPAAIASGSQTLVDYLADEGISERDRTEFLKDLERLSQSYALSALQRLGWERRAGASVSPERLRSQLRVVDEHRRLFGRLLQMLSDAGVLAPSREGFAVRVEAGEDLPDEAIGNPQSLADELVAKHPHGSNELGLLRRCGLALADVLTGSVDPLPLLFGDDGPGAADLYLRAPASLAANRMLGDTVATIVASLPEERLLRVLEVGAGTGSATAAILPVLPEDRFEYTFTDISAGFFAQAEERFASAGASIDYKPLDIEADPAAQSFNLHGYDLVIAANVLHATRDLGETLAHCRSLLVPSGQLIALEGLQRRAYQDLTFGLLDGWWRFADEYRPDHALATPRVWEKALADAGFSSAAFVGLSNPHIDEPLGSGVIIAQGPAEVDFTPGLWVITADKGGRATEVADALASCNQTVIIADGNAASDSAAYTSAGVMASAVELTNRESWQRLFEELPGDVPFKGVVHLMGLDGHGAMASAPEMAEDIKHAGASALALVQGIIDAGITPAEGVWFVTQGALALEDDYLTWESGELAGATLWGFAKVVALEASHLYPRVIDLDPVARESAINNLTDQLLFPDAENHVAYRGGRRQVARLVRNDANGMRLTVPEDREWVIGPGDPEAGLAALLVKPQPERALESGEVRIAVESMGLNFADVLLSMGVVEYTMEVGREVYGRIIETADDVEGLFLDDPVVAMGFGGFTPEMVTRASMVAKVPDGYAAPALATVPICYVTAELAFRMADLKAGERVFIHAASGGVGLAAIQLARAIGAEVFATASAPKQAYLRSLGVEHVFDSRQTTYGEEILSATGGEGVHLILNSLTGEGFIESSLSCLAPDGRFVEIGKRGIWSEGEMAAYRPDVGYTILNVDVLKRYDPDIAGASLSRVMARLTKGELTPLQHNVWPLTDIRSAMNVMRTARHIGKNVFRMPPLARGSLRRDRTYLVTGGLGGIGCQVARWLAENGAGIIVLNGRRAPDPAAEAVIRELREAGADVRVELADVADPTAVASMLARLDEALPPLAGVIHSVGVLSDGVIENQTWDRFEQVLWPKVLGAWHLHQATRNRNLDMFVLFSSITGVLGNSGQANHAAANSFLDQLAAHRRAQGLPGQAIAWGAWSGVGEAEEQRERIERQLAYAGTGWLTPQQGIKAFDWLIRQDLTTPTVTAVDWAVVSESLESPSPFLEDILVASSNRERPPAANTFAAGLLTQLREASATERESLLLSFIQQELKAVLRLPSSPSPSVSFFDLGMDSLMAVELRNRVNRALAGEYTASNTVVFDHPNAASLAGHLASGLETLTGSAPATQQTVRPRRPRVTGSEEPIAIVGMACRFPGAPDIDAFWRLLEQGGDAVTEGRTDSGSWQGTLGDPNDKNAIYRRGAFVDGIDLFDSRFFRISPIEARQMDPQQRMLLETTWEAVEDAAIDPYSLAGSRTGVFAGVGGSEYRDLIASRGQEYSYSGTNEAVTVGRVAFALGLEGPAIPIDLACASSLAAVHQAVVSLQRTEVDLAIAGGVNAILSPRITEFLMDMGMLSLTGRCHAFDAAADGFVRGEGCGMVVLKRLSDAEADGDRIWAIVLGSAVNQNGMSVGMMAPKGTAQARVMEDALARAGVVPSEIDYLEAQGVGSEFGDPIELNAAANVYGKDRDEARPLLVGSVKTNIGHLEWASGIASLLKTVLAMRNKLIPRNLHFNEPSPNVEWERLPVRIITESTDWPSSSNGQQLAAVNTFGLSGANAHVVVAGYGDSADGKGASWPVGSARPLVAPEPNGESVNPLADLTARTTRLLPLSGKTPQALRDLAQRYLEHLKSIRSESTTDAELLADMAWTAAVGRSHFPFRAGIVFNDADELREKLENLAAVPVDTDYQALPEAPKVAFVYTGQNSQPLECALTALLESVGVSPIVRGKDSAQALAGLDVDAVIEVGAGPEAGKAFIDAVAKGYEAGCKIDFTALFAGESRRRVPLPNYPFQRRRHWVDPPKVSAPAS